MNNDQAEVLHCGDLTFEISTQTVICGEKRTKLSESYFSALLLLIKESPGVVSRDALMKVTGATEGTLYKVIEVIRTALNDEEEPRCLLLTERSHGYRFVGKLSPDEAVTPVAVLPQESHPRFPFVAKPLVVWLALLTLILIGIFAMIHGWQDLWQPLLSKVHS